METKLMLPLALCSAVALSGCAEVETEVLRVEERPVYNEAGEVTAIQTVEIRRKARPDTATGGIGGDIALGIVLVPICILLGGVCF